MIQLIHKQGNNWHISINGIDCMFTPIALYIGNNLYPEKANADNGLRWRINRKWVSYNKIKIAIKLNVMSKIILRDRTIDLEPLDHTSATIKETGYDSDGRILIVKFKNGSVYAYSPILPEAYRALLQAPSAGSYLQQNIVKNKLVNAKKLEVN